MTNPIKPTNKINEKLMAKLCEALEPFPDAITFALAYRELIHQIDDLIDSIDRPSTEQILKTFSITSSVFTLPFWKEYGQSLLITEQLINNTYSDSVLWENSIEPEKQVYADTLRHTGIDMFFAVILVTLGRDKLREFSADFRFQCHNLQKDE